MHELIELTRCCKCAACCAPFCLHRCIDLLLSCCWNDRLDASWCQDGTCGTTSASDRARRCCELGCCVLPFPLCFLGFASPVRRCFRKLRGRAVPDRVLVEGALKVVQVGGRSITQPFGLRPPGCLTVCHQGTQAWSMHGQPTESSIQSPIPEQCHLPQTPWGA